jgi:hypothetical protein
MMDEVGWDTSIKIAASTQWANAPLLCRSLHTASLYSLRGSAGTELVEDTMHTYMSGYLSVLPHAASAPAGSPTAYRLPHSSIYVPYLMVRLFVALRCRSRDGVDVHDVGVDSMYRLIISLSSDLRSPTSISFSSVSVCLPTCPVPRDHSNPVSYMVR